jgi:hypothetical protein
MNSETQTDSSFAQRSAGKETLCERDKSPASSNTQVDRSSEPEKIICPHCLRTATNGIKCKGICVADSDY